MSLHYPIFDIVPDFTDPPEYGIVNPVERAGLSPARDTAFFPHDDATFTLSLKFVCDGLTDCRAIKAFFTARGGPAAPFYLPSWRMDFEPLSGTAGDNILSVDRAAFDDEFAAAPLDGGCRQLFVWQPGEDIFTSDIIEVGAVTGDQHNLYLSRFLPFTIDTETAIVGFLYLARFEDAEIAYDHPISSVARATIKFRSVRAHNGETASFDLTPVTVGDWQGFESGTVGAAAMPADAEDPRVSYSLGPAVLGTPGDHLTEWVAWVNGDGLRLAEEPDFTRIPDNDGSLTDLLAAGFVDTERLSLTFDWTGRECLAWQDTETTVRVIRWLLDDSTGDFSWSGRTPAVVSLMQLWPGLGSETSIACFYLKTGINAVYVRLSSDSFTAETVAVVLPIKPLEIRRAFVEGGILYLDLLDTGFRRVTIASPLYE